MALSLLVHWSTKERESLELCCLRTEALRSCCWGSCPGVGYVLHYDCGECHQLSVATTSPVTSAKWSWLLPQRVSIWVEGSGWWEEERTMLFPAEPFALLLPTVSAEWHLYQLLPKGVTLVKCHQLQHERSFSILHFSPCHLPSFPQVPFFLQKDIALKFKCRKK